MHDVQGAVGLARQPRAKNKFDALTRSDDTSSIAHLRPNPVYMATRTQHKDLPGSGG